MDPIENFPVNHLVSTTQLWKEENRNTTEKVELKPPSKKVELEEQNLWKNNTNTNKTDENSSFAHHDQHQPVNHLVSNTQLWKTMKTRCVFFSTTQVSSSNFASSPFINILKCSEGRRARGSELYPKNFCARRGVVFFFWGTRRKTPGLKPLNF